MVNKKQAIKVARAIIEKENSLLAVQRSAKDKSPLMWEFPGGKIENNENIEQCLERETIEEIGVKIKSYKFLFSYFNKHNNQLYEVFVYKIIPDNYKIKLSADHNGYKWLSLKEIETLDLAPGNKKTIEKLKNYL